MLKRHFTTLTVFILVLSSIAGAEDFINAADIDVVWPEAKVSPNSGPLKGGTVPQLNCKPPQFTNDSPFFVSAMQKDYDDNRRVTEPLSFTLPDGKIIRRGVPPFSIVKLLAPSTLDGLTLAQIAKIEASVEIISLPNEQVIKEMQTSSRLARAANAFPLAEQGITGRMQASVMKHVTEYAFKIKDLTVIKNFPHLEEILKDTSIRFVNKDGLYLVRECCDESRLESSTCQKQYVFEVNPDNNPAQEIKRYYDNSPNDDLFSALFPIPKENLLALAKILELIQEPEFDFIDFRYFDTRGFVRVPLDAPGTVVNSANSKVPYMQRGPLKTLHYKSDDTNANDAFGEPASICAFFQAVKEFNKTCATPACQIQWGDFYHSPLWHTHADHDDGTCIDIRPLRKREGYGSVNIWSYYKKCKKNEAGVETCTNIQTVNSEYDRAKTQEFINILAAAGGVGKARENGDIVIQNILFNDTKGVKGVTRAQGHYNHMHVCFPPKSPKVQAACLR